MQSPANVTICRAKLSEINNNYTKYYENYTKGSIKYNLFLHCYFAELTASIDELINEAKIIPK